jgi:hypothetical protein
VNGSSLFVTLDRVSCGDRDRSGDGSEVAISDRSR